MKKKPVYINVFTYAFPITAIVSILHRLSGVFVFLFIPVFLSLLQQGLYFPWFENRIHKFIIWLLLSALLYHLCAGIRHLIMDVGGCEDNKSATTSSYVVIASSILLSILVGLRLC